MGMVDQPGCFLMAVTARCADCTAESYATVVVKMEKVFDSVGTDPSIGLVMKNMNMVGGWGIRDPKTEPQPVCPKHNPENKEG